MKSKKTGKYTGIKGISLCNSKAFFYSSFNPLSFDNFLSTVNLTSIEDRGGAGSNIWKRDGILSVVDAKAEIYTPAGRSIDLYLTRGSEVRGKAHLGRIDVDETSTINIENFPRKFGPFGSTLAGVASDLAYIAAGCVPVAVFGVPLVKFFGGNPVNAIDDFSYLSAGINIGLRGDNRRALYTSLFVATASILGPEAFETVTKGLAAGLDQVELLEDGLKIFAHLLSWGVGKRVRDYYVEQTRKL